MSDNENTGNKDTELGWRGNAPVSKAFDDVYYSAENGLEETDFVFLSGIGAPDIWKGRDHFVIAETGFGTGLNFLATWKKWQESGADGRLTFISVEGYPLSEKALKEAHSTFPEIEPYAEQLRAAWPPAATGFHPREFANGQVRLILIFGQAAEAFASLSGSVDAWYLDGFAPAKNPDMWSDTLMDQIARLSHVGTRFATFTAAGFVKRALRDRGFIVEKTPGYGRKRERLVGEAQNPAPIEAPAPLRPEWAATPASPEGTIAVIGGGIAGASVAAALQARGRRVTLVNSPEYKSASQVPAAILSPRFMREHTPAAEFFTSAYAYSCAFPAFGEAWAEAHGVHQLPKNAADADRLEEIRSDLHWTADWLKPQDNGFLLPRGGSVDTAKALEAITSSIPKAEMVITRLEQAGPVWRLHSKDGQVLTADIVVLAAGIDTAKLISKADCPELRPNRGQVEVIGADTATGLPPESIAFGGYVTAEADGMRTIGSTFDRKTSVTPADYEPRDEDRIRILSVLKGATGTEIPDEAIEYSWAGVRATTADHLPFAGPVPVGNTTAVQYAPLAKDAKTKGLGEPTLHDGLYMLAGLGSKGYQYGPLLGDYLAAMICGDPQPLPDKLVAPLHPLRDLIRSIKRKQG
ncbi:bifunctional tRNA (5-methylaminomethyl-2-thiouridine)(34)-methyltransferase MnmD/FAD-dependent 5-carboxymethylaminomethyl-2-thiouridine(34) oxidoreductase MnmC [Kordiimonas lipolytica]|uniref:tRNA 5-methylaminomethyl-2-thiouridine biosynthesis bifunctional protein MnmC n=1 Tax=Kordiimonas lipolytica TaxID=1662421 RepID=A0ABV8UBB1_9PROT|nr:bifunctional tRNA (5-methylaminomethyl-2-thiouridine)(34)-methyltransferase MnmD/FAD-dependent 5-carboxymethylaminomethyl-2-thiouridine(34) oxidoreductase MnmC [Kordiimonas lipolytica]